MNYFYLFLIAYLIFHIPAIILLILAVVKRNKKPELATKLLIGAGIYFLIGGGVCGVMLS